MPRNSSGSRKRPSGKSRRAAVPILCGGTGLYFKAFLEGLGEAPPADAALRAELEATPLPDLLLELEQRDPATYEKIDRQNPRRVIRAVEVIRLTGKPFSAQRATWSPSPVNSPTVNPQPSSACRASQRICTPASMPAWTRCSSAGLVEEVNELLPHGLAENKTALQAIGYRQVVEHLRGERSLPETIELVKIRTRQFAKRQMTWFRRQAQLQWIDCQPQDSSETSLHKLSMRGTAIRQDRTECCTGKCCG